MLIARYTANASGVVPTFNEGYQYTVNETVSDGIYTVELYSDTDFTSCSFRDKSNLLTVEYLKVTSQVTTMKNMFRDCSKLTQLDLSNWDTSKVTSMSYMFATCSSLAQLDISNFNTSNVISMSCMFATCSSLTQLDVSNWNTKNVMELGSMFANCSSLTQLDASNWDTSKVTGMSYMFASCSSLTQLDVSNWDTSSVTDMINMFNSCSSLNEIIANNVSTSTLSKLVTALPTKSASSYGTIKVIETTDAITSSANAKYWNIVAPMLIAKYTTNASGVVPTFNSDYQYTVDEINNDGIYTVEIYSYDDFSSCSFQNKTQLLTVEYLKVTSKVTNMYAMFHTCSSLTQLDASNWDTSKVVSMQEMLRDCKQLTQLDVSNWDTSQVVSIYYMFSDCKSLSNVIANNVSTSTLSTLVAVLPTKSKSSYGTIKATKTTDAITSSANAKYWNVDAPMLIARYTANASGVVPTFNSGYQYTVEETVSDGIYTVELYADTDFTSCRFEGKTQLLAVEYLKVTSNVTTMRSMFQNCKKLTSINVSNWDTSNVTEMNTMFYECNSLTSADLSSFDTSNVINMKSMFSYCISLASADLSSFDTSNVTDMSYMFTYCNPLTSLDLSSFDTGDVTDMRSMFSRCNSLTSLDLSNFDTSNVTNTSDMFYYCASLNNVITTNVSTSTLSKLITALPTKSKSSYGTIKTKKTTDAITSSANAKYWNIDVPMLIARYTASASGVVPTFNSGYQYTVEETESNGIYTVEIYAEEDFTSCNFNGQTKLLTVEYLKVTNKVTTMYKGFYNCTNLTQVDASNWDTSQVTDMQHMFYKCSKLTQLDTSNWNTSKVIYMNAMFHTCSSLTQLDVSKWDTRQVQFMNTMFQNCSSLIQLDLSNWDTSKVIYMQYMFHTCSLLTQLDLSKWDTSKVTDMTYMFQNCSSLNNVIANNVSTSTLSKLVNALPTRTSDSPGSLNITGVDNINQVDTSAAKSKYWDLYFVHIHKTKISRRKSIMIGDKKIGSLYVSELKKL